MNPSSRTLISRLDRLSLGPFHLKLILALGTIWVFDGYEVSLFAVAGLEIQHQLALSSQQVGLIGSAYLLGCVIGALLFSLLSMKLGRRRLFGATLLIYILSTLLFSMAGSITQMLLARLMTGVGVGGEYTAIFAAIDEMVPCAYRGRTDLIIDGSWHLGTMMASLLSLLVYQLPGSQWRALFLLGALGVLPLFCLRSVIPESPRWLLQNNQPQQAETVIAYIERKSGVTLEGEQ